MGLRYFAASLPQLAAPLTLTHHTETNIQRSFPTTTLIIHKLIDLAALLVELINYAPLGHAFERLNLEDVLGVLRHGCGSGRGSSES
ncbi:uncharacterized protein HD556DRAFT_823147 [Suillus plorans]|uniref:Uncharacterized protein n=1 Tax=Suillus plorans TaxID=116603 RepID=A0A9P7AGS3_9AGAM|nr:uncharacterized protein HD556DRAFT_823147 [Suillus plorans]KAG1789159.1 hypothetical protein HD556DRAFT_823147 [Suillus plorans]